MLTCNNIFLGKVLDQLIHATSLKINPNLDSLGNLPGLGNFFNSLTAILFHYSLVRKKIFYRESIQTCM